jgi:hypothetical protein
MLVNLIVGQFLWDITAIVHRVAAEFATPAKKVGAKDGENRVDRRAGDGLELEQREMKLK